MIKIIICMVLGIIGGFLILAAVNYWKYQLKEIKRLKLLKKSNDTTGHRLMIAAALFDDPKTFNTLYIMGKHMVEKGSADMNEVAEEVKYLNNLKCKS